MPAEELEFYEVLGDMLVSLGRSYNEIRDKGNVTLTIDGHEVSVNPLKPRYDPDDKNIFGQLTTVYDAAQQLYRKSLRQSTPIPILCHQEHMKPVGVCRACLVEVTTKTPDGRTKTELAPACYLPVARNLEIKTLRTSDRVAKTVRTVVELLLSDYQGSSATGLETTTNELRRVAEHERIRARPDRFPRTAPDRGSDDSSPIINVDHNACILCDRCVRACNEIRGNHVIGRMGKGFETRIAFDADSPMGESSCVACGECMITCPTDALTNRSVVKIVMDSEGQLRDDDEWRSFDEERQTKIKEIDIRVSGPQGPMSPSFAKEPAAPAGLKESIRETRLNPYRLLSKQLRPGPVPAAELRELHPDLFIGISERFLDWNFGAVVRRHYKDGEVICREGDFGSTAFIIERGKVRVHIQSTSRQEVKQPSLLARLFGRIDPMLGAERDRTDPERYINIDAPVALKYGTPVAELDTQDRIFGEMTCMSQYPRSATVTALGDCTLLEVLRNVVYMLQRTRSSREILRDVYRDRALSSHLRQVDLFRQLFETQGGFEGKPFNDFVEQVKPKFDLLRAHPKMRILREGQPAEAFYMVRTGFVKVSVNVADRERVLNYIGPGGYFGEIGLLSDLQDLGGYTRRGICTATCSALDHVDLVRIRGDDFKALMAGYPDLKDHLLAIARKRLEENTRVADIDAPIMGPFIDQGLYNAQSLLVLDLEKCTRCDECARACADAHGGVTRLVREGLRFDKYLVASSCRSCFDPVCMVGCPVGSIQRSGTKEIVIKDWCIGCGKCAENCPYGNINIQELRADGRPGREATTCDLCRLLPDKQPSCVYACPHDAAHRMTGPDLFNIVNTAARQRF
jgi:Fe-S-cluster-containing hydrogenase component 2/CRP-like cAMP-binding protein